MRYVPCAPDAGDITSSNFRVASSMGEGDASAAALIVIVWVQEMHPLAPALHMLPTSTADECVTVAACPLILVSPVCT